jgi:hypothetical protein
VRRWPFSLALAAVCGMICPRPRVVDSGIDLLQCMPAQWKQEDAFTPHDQVWDQLVVSAAQMLSGLLQGNKKGAGLLLTGAAWREAPLPLPIPSGPQRGSRRRSLPWAAVDREDNLRISSLLNRHAPRCHFWGGS